MTGAQSRGETRGKIGAAHYRWIIFWVLGLGYILVYFHRLCPAVVADEMIRDLKTTGSMFGFLASAYFYPYALMQIPAGLLSDSWGPRRTITLFFFVAFAGSMLMGVSDGIEVAIVGRTLVGIGVAMLFVPTMKVLASWFKPAEFAGMTGILVALGGVGSVTATSPLALVSNHVGWRGSFLIVGGLTFVLAILVWLIVRDQPTDMGFRPVREKLEGAQTIGLWQGVKTVLSSPWFWPLASWFFFGCAVYFAFVGLWGGPYFMHVYGMNKAQAGNILMMPALGMIVGSPLLSAVSGRIRARKPLLCAAALATALVSGMFAFHTADLPVWSLYALCFLLGVFTNAIVVIGFTATKELFPVEIAGTSTGLVNLFPFLGGAILQPVMGHALEDAGRTLDDKFTLVGYENALLLVFLCGVAAFISSLFIKETFPTKKDDAVHGP